MQINCTTLWGGGIGKRGNRTYLKTYFKQKFRTICAPL